MARAFIIWNESYSVGISKIDVQHKKLIDILNNLYESFVDQTTGQKIELILMDLADYADYHFQTEEELFDEHDYPDKEKHIDEHIEFIQKLVEFNNDFKAGQSSVTFQIMNFLRNWLINHICGSDQAYVGHFKGKDV